MPNFRPYLAPCLPAVLALAGATGFHSPSPAFETAPVSQNTESLLLDGANPEIESAARSAAQSGADGTATAPSQKSVPLKLERPTQDPLLPGETNGRALTSPEQERLRLGLQRLNLEADTAYAKGDRASAYRKYFRILSLSQYLPFQEELDSLTRVGQRAWLDSQAEEAQMIAARVRELETDAGEKLSPLQQQSLAEAYESLGVWNRAIAHYETLLASKQVDSAKATAGTEGSRRPSQASTLDEARLVNRLAQLSLFSLKYPEAALYTEQALRFTTDAEESELSNSSASNPSTASLTLTDQPGPEPSDSLANEQPLPLSTLPLPSETAAARTETELLHQLAYVYEQDQKFSAAATVQQRIFPLYDDPRLVSQQPALQVAIAQNQTRSGQLVEAIASYQAAYRQSQTLQQFDVSHNALSQLAMLYRSQGQLNDALSVYNVLLQVNDLSYNLYSMTDIQISRAEILLEQQQLEQARQAYRQALHAAKLLGYREAELRQRLDALTQSRPSP